MFIEVVYSFSKYRDRQAENALSTRNFKLIKDQIKK